MSKIVSLNVSDDDIIDGIKSHDDKAATALYNQHKGYCLRFMNTKYWDHDTNQDIYQDAILKFIENIRFKKLILQNTSIQSYLNSFCFNQIKIRLKKEGKSNNKNNPDEFDYKFIKDKTSFYLQDNFDDSKIKDTGILETEEINEQVKIILEEVEAFKISGIECYKLLKLVFFKNKKISELTDIMNYTNERSAITQSYKCRKKLKERVLNRIKI
jgi:DNA-directed RNA polymerase specialized sigma24 family protein